MHRIGAIGFEGKDLMVLKSLLALVGKTTHHGYEFYEFVDQPATAHLIFLGRVPTAEIEVMSQIYAGEKFLVCCQPSSSELPDGVRVLTRCPPRVSELSALLAELLTEPAPQPPAPDTGHDSERDSERAAADFACAHCLAGAIHARIPRVLIDQALLVVVPDAPPLLADALYGARLVHADPIWFATKAPWRTAPAHWEIALADDPALLKSLRKHPPKPYLGVRFWGVLCAGNGQLTSALDPASLFGLRKMPDLKKWPHLPWHAALFKAMSERTASLPAWTTASRRSNEEIADFVNAAAAAGLLLEKPPPR